MSSTITAPSQPSTRRHLSRIVLAFILILIDVPPFLLYLYGYFSIMRFPSLDPVGEAQLDILIVSLGVSSLCAVILLWRGARWQSARMLVFVVLSLSWLGVNQIVPYVWPNPLTRETCLARATVVSTGEYGEPIARTFRAASRRRHRPPTVESRRASSTVICGVKAFAGPLATHPRRKPRLQATWRTR